VCAVHNKIYVLPKMLTKGNAVNRLQERIKSDYTICAGDSELDLSMLSIADKQFFSNPSIIKGTDRFDFAQHILRTIKSHSLGDKI
jgi:phosphoserine phosphatase